MPFVLDASVTASWAFPDEDFAVATRAGELLESSADSAIAPVLWWFELRNILIVNERRQRITSARSAIFLEEVAKLPIQIDMALNSGFLLDLARDHHLTVYDASYLSLAIRQQIPIATLDKALQSAAVDAGISLLM